MKKLFTLALVVAVLSIGGAVLANDATTAATTDKAAKAGKHAGLDKQLAELQAKKDALVKADANADTKDLDTKIDELKTKIAAKKSGKKGAKKADAAAATDTSAK